MEKSGVHRVHAVVLHLEPVARERELARGHQGEARHVEGIVEWKCGPPVGRSEIREDEAAVLARGIRPLPDALVQPAAGRLAGRLETSPVDVVHPAVIAAAQAALERNAELERGAAMRAMQ